MSAAHGSSAPVSGIRHRSRLMPTYSSYCVKTKPIPSEPEDFGAASNVPLGSGVCGPGEPSVAPVEGLCFVDFACGHYDKAPADPLRPFPPTAFRRWFGEIMLSACWPGLRLRYLCDARIATIL